MVVRVWCTCEGCVRLMDILLSLLSNRFPVLVVVVRQLVPVSSERSRVAADVLVVHCESITLELVKPRARDFDGFRRKHAGLRNTQLEHVRV